MLIDVRKGMKKVENEKRKTGRKKFRETRHPVYRGVRQRKGNKWVCEVREPNKKTRIWLGTYPTPEMAARAHDLAVLSLKGTSALFNFPHSLSLLPLPNSSSPADIKAAAKKLSSSSSSSQLDQTKPCLLHDFLMTDHDHESRKLFFDEEAFYNMPAFLDSMAEALLITPPSMKIPFDWDHVECQTDLTLWTY